MHVYGWPLTTHHPRLPLVCLHVMLLDIFQVATHIILERVDEDAVFVNKLSSPRLAGEPVHHRLHLFLLDLLQKQGREILLIKTHIALKHLPGPRHSYICLPFVL